MDWLSRLKNFIRSPINIFSHDALLLLESQLDGFGFQFLKPCLLLQVEDERVVEVISVSRVLFVLRRVLKSILHPFGFF
jgi:hypothetical protein